MTIKQQLLCYFEPKTFEFCGRKTIYELIGIKTYKKYLPTTGDIVRNRRNLTQIKIGNSEKLEELYKFERKTRNYEWRHIIGAVIFILLTIMIDRKLAIFD